MSLCRPLPTNFCLKRSHNCFFLIFWICFAIFYEFSITRLVGIKRNDNFYFPCFSVYSNILCLEMSHNDIFKFSEFFFYFFWIFYYASGWNGTWRYFLFSPLLSVSPLILAWNEAIIVFYNFLNFFVMCLEFSITHWVGMKRNDNLYFLSFWASSNQFLLEKKP